MSKPRPPHLQRDVSRHGKTVWYVRFGKGPKTRIKGVYGTPEFEAAYQAAISGERIQPASSAAKGSLEWLWMLYRQSGAWTALSLATRRQRENIMKPALKTGGKEPLSRINKNAIIKGRDKRLGGAGTQAKHFVTTMRGMFQWAINQPEITVRSDPTQGMTFKRSKNDKKGGFPVWFDFEIIMYEDRWPRGTRERVLFDIYQFTGLRRGDAAVVGKQHVREGVISLHTEKTGTLVTIPILPELQQTLDAGPLGTMCWFAKLNGGGMTKESVGNFFKDACKAAGVMDKSGHGVRKAAATEAADNEATHAQLNSIFGWKGDQMASLYTESADRKRLAASAIAKLSRTKKGTSKPPPDDEVGVLEPKAELKQG
jgi:Phage integrase family